VLYGLDRYLFGEFLPAKEDAIATVGSSAGAWRLSCLGTADPVGAIERLAELYSREQYSAQPTINEVTTKARTLLKAVLGNDGASQIVANQKVKQHIIADRCRGLLNIDKKIALGLGLGAAAISNLVSRRALPLYFERTIFNNHSHDCPLVSLQETPTQDVKLTEENVSLALLASGSIPFALEGERNIGGAKPGLYVDGGITDYHFDLPFDRHDGLVLYPHFSPRVIPGWFDKQIPWRRVNERHFDNVLMLTPSYEFVKSLPFGKIPDRSDFKKLDYNARVNYWQTVLSESRRMADEFANLVEHGVDPAKIRLFNARQSY
jgi:hypothetical protein